jgi:hypothetical protein
VCTLWGIALVLVLVLFRHFGGHISYWSSTKWPHCSCWCRSSYTSPSKSRIVFVKNKHQLREKRTLFWKVRRLSVLLNFINWSCCYCDKLETILARNGAEVLKVGREATSISEHLLAALKWTFFFFFFLQAMQADLAANWGIKATVLHDRKFLLLLSSSGSYFKSVPVGSSANFKIWPDLYSG